MQVSMLPPGPLLEDDRLFDHAGVLQPMPAAWWAAVSREDKMRFGHHYGLYSFPSLEIIEYLRNALPLNTIEIGAGNGGYCKALGIIGTDSYQQANPSLKFIYELHGQPTVNYGEHVRRYDAIQAVREFKTRSVLGAWVTHKYDEKRHNLGGNVGGVDEHRLLSMVDDYFFIGNTNTHSMKPIFQDITVGKIRTHKVAEIVHAGIHSRASGGTDFLVHITRVKSNRG